MKELAIAHDEQSYLEIIRMCARKHQDYLKSLEYLFRMKQVRIFAFHQLSDSIRSLQSAHTQEGLTPSLAIYTDVIYCLAMNKKYKEAIEQYRDMRTRKVMPEAIVYNLILEVATLARNQPLIDELVEEMWDKGIHIHPFIFDPIRKLEEKKRE
jgi:pentatricopeptide repeat protein